MTAVLIAGAGIGGLTAALALHRRGLKVDVYEQAADLKEIGAGVQIAANGSRVLYELGLGGELERIGTEPRGKQIRLWSTGREWKLIDLGAASVEKYGAPYFAFHRADLHDVLLRAFLRETPDALHLGARCVGCTQVDDGVTLKLAGEVDVHGDVLIGADGVHSQIRQALFGPDRPKFTGCVAWRGMIAADALPDGVTLANGVLWLGPHAHIMHYPLRHGAMLNFFGVVERSDWEIESWTERGSVAECAADFRDWHDDVQGMIHNMAIPYKWALIVREPLAGWSVGRVTLLGDACHSTLPFLAQGANMAIEDGCVLARCLEKHADDIPRALQAYEAARLPRTNRLVAGSAEQISRVHAPALAETRSAEVHIAREWQQRQVDDRYDWLYSYDARSAAIA